MHTHPRGRRCHGGRPSFFACLRSGALASRACLAPVGMLSLLGSVICLSGCTLTGPPAISPKVVPSDAATGSAGTPLPSAKATGSASESVGKPRPHPSAAATASVTASVAVPVRHRHSSHESLKVVGSTTYREARERFARKDYREALTLVNSLLAQKDLTEEARAYLTRQQRICQDALAGKPVGPRALSTAVASSKVRQGKRSPRPASDADCGPRALLLVCEKLKIPATRESLRTAAGTSANGTTLAGLKKAAESVGLSAEGVQMDRGALARLESPAVAWMDGNHYVAVLTVQGDSALVHDPNKAEAETVPLKRLLARSGGVLLTLTRTPPKPTAAETSPVSEGQTPKNHPVAKGD